MAYDIGPRIGIQGEKEFNNQIKQINNSLKEYGSEMKALTSKFAENENGQEALIEKTKVLEKQFDVQKQKADILQQQYNKQSEKLKDLADAYQKTVEESGKNSDEALKAENAFNKQTESVSKLKVAMNETENYMNTLQNSINANKTALNEMDAGTRDAVTGLSNLADAAKGTADQLENIDKKISAGNLLDAAQELEGVGDKITQIGSSAVESFAEVESATIKVNARFDETGEAAKTNADVIKSVYEDGVGESMDTVAEAVILVKDNLKNLNDTDLKNITEQGLILEETYGIDMSESLRGVNSLMKNFGLSATEAMDYLVAGTQTGLDKTNELGDNISEYGGKFEQAGYTTSEYFQLLKNGLEGGAYNLDKVNDAINEVTTRLADGTIEDNMDAFSSKTKGVFAAWKNGGATQKDVIDSIVADISNTTNQQDALNMAANAFGTMAEDGNLTFIESLTSVGDTYDDVSGKAEKFQDDTTTTAQKMEATSRKVEDAIAPLGESIADIAVAMSPVIDVIAKIIEKFSELPMIVQAPVLAIMGLIVAISKIAPVMAALNLSGIIGVLAKIGPLITSTILPAISGALPIIIGVIAAVTAVILIIKNWGTISEWFKGVWETVSSGILTAWEAVKQFFDGIPEWWRGIWKGISDFFSSIWNGIKSVVTTIADAIKTKAVTAFESLRDGIKSAISKVADIIKSPFDTAKDFIVGLAKDAFKWGSDFIDGLKDGIMSGVRHIINAIKGIADQIRSLLHFSRPDEGPLRDYETWMPDMMEGLAQGIYDNINKIKAAAGAVSGTINSTINETMPEMVSAAAVTYSGEIVIKGGDVIMDGRKVGQMLEKRVSLSQRQGSRGKGYV
ncbi:MAG: hypothetical protein SOR93_03490 [Clostridiales Family XIII bacterium]|uniref:phage tail tape measure protein n=1 Tax=Hominibacterium faecale TaxID=2839743 RepID=UPI0022B2A8D5|nr:phage tail tape measure protein [Hominibacterium faecale]MCI7301833.1 hypothetical protein [Clostridia bacterium]MDY3010310.1 hypothetical protein [Clostridiales Family XIII bacterium]